MNSKEQYNKPERTAMDVLIDFAKTKIYNTDGPTLIINKAIELRDTVEKEQRVSDHLTGFAAQIHYNHGIDYHAALNKQFGIDGK